MKVTAAPNKAAIDQAISILVTEAGPHAELTLRLATLDALGGRWFSWAKFRANADGVLDATKVAPDRGSYSGVDGMGLFWSLCPVKRGTAVFTAAPLGKVEMTLTCTGLDGTACSIEIERAVAPQVKKRAAGEGLYGAFFCQEDLFSAPAILVLPGSDGLLKETAAALLASHGYAVLALAYFGYEGLPESLVEIPVEYFRKALDWLKLQPEADGSRLGVIGLSRGGELALLLGATYPDIGVVVAGSPSGIVHAGLNGTRPSPRSAWSLSGRPITAARVRVTPFQVVLIWVQLVKNLGSFSLRTLFTGTLRAGEEATIKVERINGPVLLISGDEDGLWPATTFSEMVVARLQKHNHPFPDEHLRFAKAGHFVCFPYSLPFLPPMVAPIRSLYFGGSRHANAHSAIDSWDKILRFLASAFSET